MHGVGGEVWGISIAKYDLEDTAERRLYYEEGTGSSSLSHCTSDALFQLSREVMERSAELRADFAAHIGTYDPDQLVFVDESAVDRQTTYRGRAWAIRGKPAMRKAFFCRGLR